jgi:hypothetical protein
VCRVSSSVFQVSGFGYLVSGVGIPRGFVFGVSCVVFRASIFGFRYLVFHSPVSGFGVWCCLGGAAEVGHEAGCHQDRYW